MSEIITLLFIVVICNVDFSKAVITKQLCSLFVELFYMQQFLIALNSFCLHIS